MLKCNKGGEDFTAKSNKFYLDVGWIRLTKMLDFEGMLGDFKSADIDPRELILLYKNLLLYNQEAAARHYKSRECPYDLKTII